MNCRTSAGTDGGAFFIDSEGGQQGQIDVIEDCLFKGNEAGNDGGVAEVDGVIEEIRNCIFEDNYAEEVQ